LVPWSATITGYDGANSMYLDLDGEGPRYAQLIRSLKAAILDGRFAAGARLPASRSLARELDI
jgi:GntR family transcriptional regulator/MocR family aminotransferase